MEDTVKKLEIKHLEILLNNMKEVLEESLTARNEMEDIIESIYHNIDNIEEQIEKWRKENE